MSALLLGVVVESKTPEGWTGEYLYSDFAIQNGLVQKNSLLNNLSQIPFIGILAGLGRIALGIIHSVGHLLAYFGNMDKGHIYHAAKGGCEILRGSLEAIPILGRIFSWLYMAPLSNGRCWWMIKMYNPSSPDGLDRFMGNWTGWKSRVPQLYINAEN